MLINHLFGREIKKNGEQTAEDKNAARFDNEYAFKSKDVPPFLNCSGAGEKARTDLPVFWTPLEMENSPSSLYPFTREGNSRGRGKRGGRGLDLKASGSIWTSHWLE